MVVGDIWASFRILLFDNQLGTKKVGLSNGPRRRRTVAKSFRR